ncbi:MAG TPA: GlsB/YeaQ/YmgE family stress response membrane protein [Pyrinomonadaceae bacterium]|jgi:uncharacterized membrane protein YeaQ/YmgE (transglycosylase-associated protein family)
MIYSLISWAVFGVIAGVIAKLLMPGKDPGGCIITMMLGIAGALVGGFIASRIFGFASNTRSFNNSGFLVPLLFAVIGAIILLAIYRVIAKKRA